MRPKTFIVFLVVFLVASMNLAFGQKSASEEFEIRLQSRHFSPPEEIALGTLLSGAEDERVHVLLQFKSIPDSSKKNALKNARISLLNYLPRNTWFASVPSNLSPDDPALSTVRWIGAILPEDKIPSYILERGVENWPRNEDGTVTLKVTYFRDVPHDKAVATLIGLGAKIGKQHPGLNSLEISLKASRIHDVASEDIVRWVERATPPIVQEMSRARSHVHADSVQAIPYNLTGLGVKVGIFEMSHAWQGHGDFTGRISQGDLSEGYDPGNHATMTTGTIGGDGTWSPLRCGPADQWKGMAPQASLITYDMDQDNDDRLEDTNMFGDFESALNDNIDIANNSWGFYGCHQTAPYYGYPYGDYVSYCRAFDALVRGYNLDTGTNGDPVVVVFSAGNERNGYGNPLQQDCTDDDALPYQNYKTVNAPKAAKNILVVGAVDGFDNTMSYYSSWGPTSDGRIRPDLVAPGQFRMLLQSGVRGDVDDSYFGVADCYADGYGFRTPGFGMGLYDDYGWFGQTSCAAAVTSGSIALLLEDYRAQFPTLDDPLPSTVKALLIHTAQDLDDGTTWYNKGPDYASGYGLLQIRDAIDLMRTRSFLEGQIDMGEKAIFYFTVPDGANTVKVTLAWDDPPAAENATSALINDLDLIVVDPNGLMWHRPWTLDKDNPTAPAIRTQRDDLNNVEQVYGDGSVTAGTWKIMVLGTHVPEGPQKFSLVANEVRGVSRIIEKGLQWLRSQQNQQAYNGHWTWSAYSEESVWLTSMAVLAFLNHGINEPDITVIDALDWLLAKQRVDGCITNGDKETYDTALAILAFVATRNIHYYSYIKKGVDYLISSQWDLDWGYGPNISFYGAWNYISARFVPDISALELQPWLRPTQVALLALYYAEQFDTSDKIVPDDVWEEAKLFMTRQQVLSSPPDYSHDGGFKEGFHGPHGQPSMPSTAEGLISLYLLEFDRWSPEVDLAWIWLGDGYAAIQDYPTDWELYHYFCSLAFAGVVWDMEDLGAHLGMNLYWYKDMMDALAEKQSPDGHWTGTNPSSWETDIAATALAILALESKQIPPGTGLNFTAGSPVELRVTDPKGLLYSATGPPDEPKSINISNPVAGAYEIELIGTGDGHCTLTIESLFKGNVVSATSHTVTIEAGQTYDSTVTVASIVGPITIDSDPGPEFQVINADIDRDGDVDGGDLALLIQAYGADEEAINYDPLCDFVFDGVVDDKDLGAWAPYFGRSGCPCQM